MACTPLNFPAILEAPSYPCARLFSTFIPSLSRVSSSNLAIDSPLTLSGSTKHRKSHLILTFPVSNSTNCTQTDNCSFVDLSVHSSAITAKHTAQFHSLTIWSDICFPHIESNSFWMSGDVYLYPALVFSRCSHKIGSSIRLLVYAK